jgi:hypothetical protein
VLLALAGVNRQHLVRQAGLFQKKRNLGRIGRRMEIEADHLRSVSFMSVRMACVLTGLSEHAECLTGSSLKNRPRGMTSDENAQPHHSGQQQPGNILGVQVRRYAAVTLACDHASPEECLQLADPCRHDVSNVRIMRRHGLSTYDCECARWLVLSLYCSFPALWR